VGFRTFRQGPWKPLPVKDLIKCAHNLQAQCCDESLYRAAA
jgi:hypothetical protein